MAIWRWNAICLAHLSAVWALAASQSTSPLSRIWPVALSIKLWRHVLPEKGVNRSEPLSSLGSLSRETAGD